MDGNDEGDVYENGASYWRDGQSWRSDWTPAPEAGRSVRLLVRPGSRSKVPADPAQAAEIVEDEQTAFQASSVVSAVQGGPETIVDAQLRFLRAARKPACDASLRLTTR